MRCYLCKDFFEEDKSNSYRKCLVCNKFICMKCFNRHVLTHILQIKKNGNGNKKYDRKNPKDLNTEKTK